MGNTEKEITSDEPKYRGVKAMPFVIGNETFEKLGTLGTLSNLLVYLTTVFHMDTITSTNLINIFNGTCNFGTLLGAFLSDTYFGRYKTLAFASIFSFLGMLILTLTDKSQPSIPPTVDQKSPQPLAKSNVNWALGLAIPTFLMFLSCVVFFIGTRIYVMVVPHGSPLTSVVQVTKNTNDPRFLNKAAIITIEDQIKPDGSKTNPWRLCKDPTVEEVKCVLRVLPIWAAGPSTRLPSPTTDLPSLPSPPIR
ncbi:Protein NRT1/ PTR FAMILY 2.12 [Camellia lanceoleosa]|uniref:Protein NRT1/ PTR FAMILY 2.12 n=1 Tax=Camellia lanceoleosa TaxID=1840588 RepID=A0ACC0F8Z6_9ERIC|nr:Protein NRT1/ PTR FAMILY 2.12 [Camellia lanceoleosa]